MVGFSSIVYIIGIITIIKYLFKLLGFIRKHILLTKNDLKKKYGDGYVIITGGSRGIGFSFAKEFLKLKFKICLISSNKENLEKAKSELLELYPCSTVKIIDFNLNQFYYEETIKKLEQKIKDELKGEEISILLNNAGVFIIDRFDALPEKHIASMINVNIYGLTILTKIIIEHMKKRNKKSLIVGSGSFGGQFRGSKRVVYCATKSYVEAFYEGLGRDFPDKFDFTLIEIGPVRTEMNRLNFPLTISADDFASECINLLGKYSFIQGCRKHAILKCLMSLPLAHFVDEKIAAD